jgi:hypothetical protein
LADPHHGSRRFIQDGWPWLLPATLHWRNLMNNLIEETNVTIVNLSLELERAVIEHTLQDDESIYVTEDNFFPFWIKILKGQGFVGFTTYAMFREGSTTLQRLELVNALNKDTYLSSAYADDDMLRIEHCISYRNGILSEALIRGCRQFSGGIKLFISEYDPEYQILMRLTESETEPKISENE